MSKKHVYFVVISLFSLALIACSDSEDPAVENEVTDPIVGRWKPIKLTDNTDQNLTEYLFDTCEQQSRLEFSANGDFKYLPHKMLDNQCRATAFADVLNSGWSRTSNGQYRLVSNYFGGIITSDLDFPNSFTLIIPLSDTSTLELQKAN